VTKAIAELRAAIRLRPDDAYVHTTLGAILCDEKRDYAGAEAEFHAAIRLQPDDAQAHYNLGNALKGCGEVSEATAEYRTAIRLQPDHAEAHCNLGHVLRGQGDYAGSLAMLRRGHELGTRQSGWSYPSAQWVAEAERLAAMAARLPALLKGEDRPKDVAERLSLGQMCYDTKRFAAAARFWGEALVTEPTLGDDRRAGHRYNAACVAALAAAGQATDDPKPDDAARAMLRVQALDRLKAEFAAWEKMLDSGDAQARPVVAQTLQHWKVDPDLAGVRDAEALARLPESERVAWRSLWSEVDALLARSRGGRP
jgi:Tfp pilus assembly protein PilF